MAALVATAPAPLLTLDKALQIQDLRRSRTLYNKLPDDSAQPVVANEHIANLAALFVHHNAEKVLGIHLIHGHFEIPENTVMVGTNFENPDLRWAKTMNIDEINPLTIHGHIFALAGNELCPYELQCGPLPDLSRVGHGFLADFLEYIVKNNLQDIIGLQILGCSDHSMSELILEQATVMLDSSIVRNAVTSRITGWRFKSINGSPRYLCALCISATALPGVPDAET
ncbi:hypothetical protein N7541_000136 [Penicillium brevicompactum]|uniref:Uncharacterized protein n=1 Tax=Penicillium brevicompactum TaxID=5074 RepID=A0A9W9RV48_PENBR|nr:hypothetical protein N7541_000136 [Penicillium brevicompactum]